ncbi:hypothetical protein NE237_009205 [Protea cynaroides]|uniref:Uncharacterized protein n=1 Tax=Protea cynaroides TaxID=273540 RepID=A0A9Q0KXA4_9MAGN|nr:hypothetical protein NE237_009205 [Protea cynaroides]
MNEAQIPKQIQKMNKFILQEAEEKANEIYISAEEEYNIEKLRLVEEGKRKIREEYEHKLKQLEVRFRMEYSKQVNAFRIKLHQAQDDVVNAMKKSASKELLHVTDDTKTYGKLLKDLTVQSLSRLKEPLVLLRCREVDCKIVESVLDEAKQQYAEKAKVHPPKVTIDDCVYLPPPPTDVNSHGPFCSGGVVLASQNGKIVNENTLDARLDLAFLKKLPEKCDSGNKLDMKYDSASHLKYGLCTQNPGVSPMDWVSSIAHNQGVSPMDLYSTKFGVLL